MIINLDEYRKTKQQKIFETGLSLESILWEAERVLIAGNKEQTIKTMELALCYASNPIQISRIQAVINQLR